MSHTAWRWFISRDSEAKGIADQLPWRPCIAHDLRNMPCNSRLQGNPENNNPENNNKVSNWA
jgi:hypothetical protein